MIKSSDLKLVGGIVEISQEIGVCKTLISRWSTGDRRQNNLDSKIKNFLNQRASEMFETLESGNHFMMILEFGTRSIFYKYCRIFRNSPFHETLGLYKSNDSHKEKIENGLKQLIIDIEKLAEKL